MMLQLACGLTEGHGGFLSHLMVKSCLVGANEYVNLNVYAELLVVVGHDNESHERC